MCTYRTSTIHAKHWKLRGWHMCLGKIIWFSPLPSIYTACSQPLTTQQIPLLPVNSRWVNIQMQYEKSLHREEPSLGSGYSAEIASSRMMRHVNTHYLTVNSSRFQLSSNFISLYSILACFMARPQLPANLRPARSDPGRQRVPARRSFVVDCSYSSSMASHRAVEPTDPHSSTRRPCQSAAGV